jgi:hypothetical protein
MTTMTVMKVMNTITIDTFEKMMYNIIFQNVRQPGFTRHKSYRAVI